MPELRFDWHAQKAAANYAKHRISFDEAATAFTDEDGLLLDDPTIPWTRIASFCSG